MKKKTKFGLVLISIIILSTVVFIFSTVQTKTQSSENEYDDVELFLTSIYDRQMLGKYCRELFRSDYEGYVVLGVGKPGVVCYTKEGEKQGYLEVIEYYNWYLQQKQKS